MSNAYSADFWWEYPLSEDGESSGVHSALFDQVRAIEENQYSIARQNYLNACLYANRELPGMDWATGSERQTNYAPVSMTAENLTSSVVETVSALVGKNRPKPTPVVKDAMFSVERQARLLDRYLYAEFKANNVYAKSQMVFTDSCWGAIGALKIDLEHDENGEPVDIYCERVLPDEIVVDQREALCGPPLQMYQRKLVPKAVLKAQYPEFRTDIDDAQGKNGWFYTSYRTPTAQSVVVVEAWRLPFMGQPGRHSIVIENATLLDEEYDRSRFPFVFMRWFPLPAGFYSRPLVEEIAPFQLRHNDLNIKIRLAQDRMAVPRIFADVGSKITVETLDNSIAKVIRTRGNRPEAVIWPAMGAEIYAERERIRAGAFEQAGISQMSAQSKLPEGARLDSSKALREFNLIENQRFAKQAQAYENFHLEVAEHFMELGSILHGRGSGRKVVFHQRSVVQEIDWGQVAELVDSNHYSLQIEASSIMNMTPAARTDTVNTWVFNGWIPPERGLALLGHPDIEEEVSLLSAAIDDIKFTLEQLDSGELPVPLPYQDLQTGVRMAQLTYLRRRQQLDVPKDILRNYEDWIAIAQGLVDQATAMSNAAQKQAEQAAMMQLQSNLQPTNVGPEGNIMPGGATTAQGTPVEALLAG